MRIIVASIGSRGDVQPYINLCQGLHDAGHEVVLATNPSLNALASSHGVRSAPVGPAVDMGAVGARLMAESFNNMWIGMIRVMQLGARLVEAAYPDVLRVCQGADLVVTSDTGSGIAEADKLGIPWISVTLQPARIPTPDAAQSSLGRILWAAMGKLFIAPTNRFRRRVGAPPVRDMTSLLSTRMILLPVSQRVAVRDLRWPRHVLQTGYWFARPQTEWEPPADLIDFIERGDKPIAISLGVMSMSGARASQSAHIILAALDQTKARAIIQGWDEALDGLEIPNTVYHAGAIPHSWLFDQVSTVIHHGGFGTTAATLRAGVPGVVVPHVIDQFYWGQRVHQLGVSPCPIARGKLSARGLGEAILQARNDGELRAKASKLGESIRSEPDGVATAVRAIQAIPATPSPY